MQTAKATSPHRQHEVTDPAGPATGEAARLYQWVREQLLQDGEPGMQRLLDQGRKWMRDLGVTFHTQGDQADADQVIPFDPFPRILGAEEWAVLGRGVQQRLAIWNEFFKDIYSTQEAIKAGIVPVRWVYDDPGYHRGAVGVEVPGNVYATIAAFDVVRREEGDWMVVEDYLSHTTGAVYALQARNVLRQVCPRLVDAPTMLAAADYPARLLEHLRRHAQSAAPEPRPVLLSPGSFHPAYFEDALLARQMGIPVVQGSDLIVVNSHVYFKTIGGLEPIDIIYRRLDEPMMDPLEFRDGSQQGVAGLMNCVRKGTVLVTNAFGAGLGDNRALPTLMARLAKFYFNEPLLLPTGERYVLDDPDQLEHVAADLPDYRVTRAFSRSAIQPQTVGELTPPELDALRHRIRAEPAAYVAERRWPANQLPCVTTKGFSSCPVGLRLFAFGGRQASVAPCALTRFSTASNSEKGMASLGGGIKDTWILDDHEALTDEPPIVVRSGQRRLRLGSRTADSLYWMGRYSERAENVTRILQVLHTATASRHAFESAADHAPLLESLAQATGYSRRKLQDGRLPRRQSVTRYFLEDADNPASIRRCLQSCRVNARQIRGSLPPEIWQIIDRLARFEAAPNGSAAGAETGSPLPLMEAVLRQVDELSGAVQKNMLQDDQWHFWTMGVGVERALNTLLVMRPILVRRPHPVTGEWRREEHHLDALLGMLSSRYAYRSLYQSRPTPENLAHLLLLDEQVPRSVLCCLRALHRSLGTVAPPDTSREAGDTETPLRLCGQLCSQVEYADLRPFFSTAHSRSPRLRNWLDQLATRVAHLSTLIGDHYLIHQAFNIIR